MRTRRSIKISTNLILVFLSINVYSQYGIIEMKNGDLLEIAEDKFRVEDDQLRYFIEKIDSNGFSLYGITNKKQKEEYLKKTNVVDIREIKKIHTQGELFVGSKSIANFTGIRYIKEGRHYEKLYVIEEGECSLLIKPEDGNAVFSYYLQKRNEDLYILHKSGTGLGPKLKSRSKKYFADCEPAMEYIKNDLKLLTVSELIKIYNSSCSI